MKLSLHMIVRNSERKLQRTFNSVKTFVDEIIIVDTGSTDGTKELAKSLGAEVYDFKWIDDFSAARNFALSKTTGDWVMWLDAGDVIYPDAIERFEFFKNNPVFDDPNCDVNYIVGFLNREYDENGNPYVVHATPRLAKKSADPHWVMPIHEAFVVDNPISEVDELLVVDDPEGQLKPASKRNLDIIEDLIKRGDDPARNHYLRVRELYYLGRYQQAVENYKLIHRFPLDNGSLYDLYLFTARSFNKLGNKEKEREMLLGAVFCMPQLPDAFVMLGDIEFSNKQWERAIPYYRAALREPGQVKTWVKTIPYHTYEPLEKLGQCYEKLNDLGAAVYFYNKAMDVAPWSVSAQIQKTLAKLDRKIK